MPGAEVERRPVPPLPVPVRRVPESLPAKMALGVLRRPHLSVPLAVPPGLWAVAEAAHVIGPVACGPVSTVAVLGSAWIWAEAPRRYPDPPGVRPGDLRWWQSRAWWARASCAAGCGWVSLAAWTGPAGPSAPVLGVMLLAGSTAWGARYWHRKRPRREKRRRGRQAREEARQLADWDTWWQLHAAAWGASGSRVVNVTHDGVTVILRVRLVGGRQVPRTLQQNERLIESALEGLVDAGMVRVAGVPGSPHLADVYVKQADPLGEFIEWEEGLAPSSVHDPFPEGRMESGKWRMTRQRVSSFIVGTTGSGKTNGQLSRIACLSRCPDARTVVIDLKGGRSGRPVLRAAAAEYVITTLPEARGYLLMVAAEIEFRAMNAGLDGEEQLEATEQDPAIMTLIDEVNGVASQTNGDASCRRSLARIASQGRGVECWVDAAAQIGTLEESVGERQVRSNMDRRVSYRTAEPREGAYALGEDTRVDTSKLAPVGTFLAKLGPDSPQEKIRGILMTREKFAAVAWSRLEDPPLGLYCGSEQCPVPGYRTWQEWWSRRWERLPEAFRGDSPQYRQWAESQPQPESREPQEDTPAPQPAPAPQAPPPATVAAPAGPPPPGAPEHVRRAAFTVAAQACAGTVVTPAQLAAASGMGRTWVQQRLRYLVTAGAATQAGRGEYVMAPGADIASALAAEKAGEDDALAAFLGGEAADRPRLHAV